MVQSAWSGAADADAVLLRGLGAQAVFDYHTEPLESAVGSDSVDIWVDNYGYDPDMALSKLRSGGVYVSLTHTLPKGTKPGVSAFMFSCNSSRADNLDALRELVTLGQTQHLAAKRGQTTVERV